MCTASYEEVATCQVVENTNQPSCSTSAETPRKVYLKYRLKLKNRQCKRWRSKCDKISGIKFDSSKQAAFSALETLASCLTKTAYELLSAQIKHHGKKKIRWTDSQKTVALALSLYGCRTYKFLRKIFRLPSKSSLHRWLKNVFVEPGINDYMIEVLKAKVSVLPECDIIRVRSAT